VGHLGKDALAAAALGNTWFNALYNPLVGVTSALDTLFAQASNVSQEYSLFLEKILFLWTGESYRVYAQCRVLVPKSTRLTGNG
jgi:hypothetical protein